MAVARPWKRWKPAGKAVPLKDCWSGTGKRLRTWTVLTTVLGLAGFALVWAGWELTGA